MTKNNCKSYLPVNSKLYELAWLALDTSLYMSNKPKSHSSASYILKELGYAAELTYKSLMSSEYLSFPQKHGIITRSYKRLFNTTQIHIENIYDETHNTYSQYCKHGLIPLHDKSVVIDNHLDFLELLDCMSQPIYRYNLYDNVDSNDVIDRLGIRLSSKLHEYTHPMYGGIVKYIAYVCSNYLSKLIELAAIKYAMVGAVQMKLGRDRIRDDKIKVDIKSLRDLIEDKLNYIENGIMVPNIRARS